MRPDAPSRSAPRPPLLFLAHRIPYPPMKGDKIRSWNILRHLSQSWDVRLGAFVDDPEDWRHAESLRRWCSQSCLVPLRPRRARLASLRGLLSGEPLSVLYFRHRRLAHWVDAQLREGVGHAFVFSSTMAQYLMGPAHRGLCRVVDMVDVDSQKFRDYAEHHGGPLTPLYAREGRELLRFERRVAREFDETLLVSEPEARLFRRLAPESAGRVTALTNGVDTEYFSPRPARPNPYPEGRRALVFTGAMDYLANVNAVTWFCETVWPELRRRVPQAGFHIVGARPTEAVRRLGRLPGVEVTGAVPDIRPYLAHAVAAVAPLRIARGLQNKVLEAMAMARPVVATPAAMEGIDIGADYADCVQDAPERQREQLQRLLERGDEQGLGPLGRTFVLRHHAWDAHLAELDRVLRAGVAEARPPVAEVAA